MVNFLFSSCTIIGNLPKPPPSKVSLYATKLSQFKGKKTQKSYTTFLQPATIFSKSTFLFLESACNQTNAKYRKKRSYLIILELDLNKEKKKKKLELQNGYQLLLSC
jgi:hypothetical protein